MLKKWFVFATFTLVFILALSACQPAAPAEAPTPETAAQPTEEPSRVGGTLVFALSLGPDTLDMQKTANGISDLICSLLGGALVDKDPATGEIVPYLAESWEIAEDGLTYTFHLKEGVKFHDGTPFTAQEYAFTINRALNPDTASPGTAGMLGGVQNAEATDDSTLVLHLAAPNAVLLENLSSAGYMMPFSQAYVEAHDAEFLGRNPMSTGPYIFKEWITGEKLVIERNPDYTWGPAYGPGPFNFETIEFRLIPEESTVTSGMEAGDLDLYETSTPTVINQLAQLDTLKSAKASYFGIAAIMFNVGSPKLADINLRKAINYALNRQAIVDLVNSGYASPAYGPFGPTVYGYDAELEQIGYNFDAEKAKSLLEESGYALNADGLYEKDGELLSFTLNTMSTSESDTKMAEVIQQQLKDVGITTEIVVMEFGQAIGALMGGQFELSIMSYGMPNASILNLVFGAQSIGGALYSGLPESAAMFEQVNGVMTITDPTAWLENLKQTQRTIVLDLALIAPVLTPQEYIFYDANIEGLVYSIDGEAILNNAYFVQK